MNRTAFRFPQPADVLPFDGERFVSGLLGDATSGDIQSEHYHRYLFALQFCEGKDVLDIASGEGYGSCCLGQVARSVVGVDANLEAVDFANRNYLTDRVSFKAGRAQSIPIADASIDVVVSFETLEHFSEHEIFASEVRRVLRPGGMLLISSPNRVVYSEEANYHNEWHLRELDRREFLELLSDNFAHVQMFAQRPLSGSVIAIDDAGGEGRPDGFILRGDGIFHRTDGIPHPPFFIALASDTALPSVHSSVLQNPALLNHIDMQRRQALDEAGGVAAKAADLEQALAAAQAERAERAAALAKVEAERAALVAALDGVRSEAEQLGAELRRVSGQTERVEAVRQELTASRRRNQELAAEVDILKREQDELARERNDLTRERNELTRQRDALAWERDVSAVRLNLISESTAWKMTGPLRRLGASLPPGLRRTLRSCTGRRSRAESFLPPPPEAVDHAPEAAPPAPPPVPPPAIQPDERRPSDLQRQLDPAWLEPNERPEFIKLRGLLPRARIAVVVHVYYPEIWPELAQAISNIPEDFDLFVTLVTGASEAIATTIRDRFPAAHVLVVDNHGRDMFPFLALIRTGALFQYELICKIHSKRSTYRQDGEEWRKYLVENILGSAPVVQTILDGFRADPDVGLVVAPGHIYGGRTFWASNEARAARLLRTIGLDESAFERDFVGGSIFWVRPLILRSLSALGLGYDDFEPEPISHDGYTAHAVERIISIICYDSGMKIVEAGASLPMVREASDVKVHVIANYLPQFHPIPENDAWWGKGFTEWTNVSKALPLFRGHRQPRLPADLGFYDLRLPETRAAQTDLARIHGITAFSYYYYWFNGRKLLNQPIEAVLSSGEPDFPFMICWANEPWTRNWDGLSKEILLPQDYPDGWERAFAADVAQIMRDPRYLRLGGKPMLAVYRVAHFPDSIGSIQRLRAAFAEEGFPAIHLMGGWVQIGEDEALPADPADMGLDAYFEFPPHKIPAQPLEIPETDRFPGFAAHVYDYGATVDAVLDQLREPQPGFRHRAVMMGWDNTARRGTKSFAFHGATPANFRRWLRATLRTARSEARGPENAVFINAWNEWAEGTYLEPDRDFGTGWLEAVASATADANPPRLIPCTHPNSTGTPAKAVSLDESGADSVRQPVGN